MKTQIYNLIVLDESGSMSPLTQQTIDGCNETINTIRAAAKEFAEDQEHLVSIYAFQSGGSDPSRYLIKNVPIAEVNHITEKDYIPYGRTPLLDAVGCTLSDLKEKVHNDPTAIANVTIITDGMENSSTLYTQEKVSKMIASLKELGWSFNFIGANIDVITVSRGLNIDNAMRFHPDASGTRDMFAKERQSRLSWLRRHSKISKNCDMTPESMSAEEVAKYRKAMKEAANDYFEQ